MTSRRQPVPPEVAQHVLARDGGCVGPRVGMTGRCGIRIELDHILGGGMGRKGPSTPDNLVSLCTPHHQTKTYAARFWRPELVDYVRRAEERLRLRG